MDISHPRPRRLCTYRDRKSTRLNSSHLVISYAVFCLKKKNTLRSLRQHGVRMAMDDSGMGNAGGNYLRQLPAYELVMARDFVLTIVSHASDSASVRAM